MVALPVLPARYGASRDLGMGNGGILNCDSFDWGDGQDCPPAPSTLPSPLPSFLRKQESTRQGPGPAPGARGAVRRARGGRRAEGVDSCFRRNDGGEGDRRRGRAEGAANSDAIARWYPRRGSNSRLRLRRPALYPLSYRGTLHQEYHGPPHPNNTPRRAVFSTCVGIIGKFRHSGETLRQAQEESRDVALRLCSLCLSFSGFPPDSIRGRAGMTDCLPINSRIQ